MTRRTRTVSTRLAALLLVALADSAGAQTAAQRQVVEVIGSWGLIGEWSLDCSKPPSQQNGYLNYVVRDPGIAVHVRNFGDNEDSHEVLGARLVGDGELELTVRFRFNDGAQTRQWVLIKRGDRVRAISNVNLQNGTYSIRDGRFVHNGAETRWQSRCNVASSEMTEGSTAPK